MGVLEVISAIVLIIACVFIIIVVLMQETKQNMSQSISGASSDNYFQKNSGRSKEARLNKTTKLAAIIFFIVALAVNVINVNFGNKAATPTPTTSTTSTSSTESADSTAESSVESAVDSAVESATSASETSAD